MSERTVKFTEYMHEEKWYVLEELQAKGHKVSEEAREKLIYAFYEVSLETEVNLDTGEITLIKATL